MAAHQALQVLSDVTSGTPSPTTIVGILGTVLVAVMTGASVLITRLLNQIEKLQVENAAAYKATIPPMEKMIAGVDKLADLMAEERARGRR